MTRAWRAYQTAAVLAATACDGSEGMPTGNGQPGTGSLGMRIVAGNNITDTVGARPVQALTVMVRRADGTLAIGETVRFQSLPASSNPYQFRYPVLVASLASPDFQIFAADTTDAAGSASVVIGFSNLAAAGMVQVSAPGLGFADTARYTVVAGNVARVIATPADTQLYVGGTMQAGASTQDAWGNPRQDPILYSVLGPAVNVTATGLVTAVGTGVGRVVARVGGFADTISVGVIPPGIMSTYRGYTYPEGIVVVGVDGQGETFLAPAAVWSWPASSTWNPAGTHIVFVSSDRLHTVAASGGGSTRLISPAVTDMTVEVTPQIARSAGTVFFTAGFSGAPLSIWRTNADGSNPVEVLADALHSYQQPGPRPDGTRVAVVGDNTTIRVLDVALQSLSSWSVSGVAPHWSPVGDQIAYFQQGTVRIVNADGTNDRLVSPPGRSYNPWTLGWSPDAQWILVSRDGTLELIEPAIGGAISLRHTPRYFYPTWKP